GWEGIRQSACFIPASHPCATSEAMPPRADQPLRRDVRFLGGILGQVIVEQEGPELFALEERIRKLAIRRRRGPREERRKVAAELAGILEQIPIEQVEPIIRAFSHYFQLVNLAEQHHRLRRTRAHEMAREEKPQRGSLAAILDAAKTAGVPAEAA